MTVKAFPNYPSLKPELKSSISREVIIIVHSPCPLSPWSLSVDKGPILTVIFVTWIFVCYEGDREYHLILQTATTEKSAFAKVPAQQHM